MDGQLASAARKPGLSVAFSSGPRRSRRPSSRLYRYASELVAITPVSGRIAGMRPSIVQVALLCAVVAAAACADPQRDKLDRGMTFARRMFVEASRNPIAAQALGSNAEMGGNLTTYLAANM